MTFGSHSRTMLGTAASRGYDRAWQRIRVQAFERDKYLCQNRLGDGRVTPTLDVDHTRAVAQAPELRLNLDNLQSLVDRVIAGRQRWN
jgi:5-methylcytosine-specific restriction protein A